MNILKNKSGFSLIEILIAIGLLGALSAWMMNIFTQQTKNEKTTATNMDIDAIGQEIRNVLGDGSSCEKTLAGLAPNANASITEIKKVLPGGTVQGRYAANDRKIGNSGIVITGYTLRSDETYLVVPGQKSGETVLFINYDRGKMVSGAKLKSYRIPLTISLDDAGKITACHALGSTTNIEAICNSLGRSVDSTNRKCEAPPYVAGDFSVLTKFYTQCAGGSADGEKVLTSWTATGAGSVRLSWTGFANNKIINWKISKNDVVLETDGVSGSTAVDFSWDKMKEIEIKKNDIIKYSVYLSGKPGEDCIDSGTFFVGVDLLNMM